MESVYQKEHCSWVSEKICLRDYFSAFSAAISTIGSCKNIGSYTSKVDETNNNIMELMDVSFTNDEMKILSETCSINQLKVPGEPPLVDVKCVKARPGLYDKSRIPEAASDLETIKRLSKRIMNVETIGQLKYRSSIWLRDDLFQAADLEIGKHFLVTVRVYHPFCHKIGMRNTHGPRCSQEIVLLGNQMLTDLRDKILCPSDLAVSSEVSENPDQNVTQKTTDEYKSGFIFIEDTFYSDYRDPTNRDYSRVIREWAASHDLGPFQTGVMEETKFEALTVRLGYPYVYQHQGNCEHLIVFSDLRLLHVSDSLSLQNYPCCRSISSANARYCMICNYYVARWITFENERVPFDPCFFCEHCFRSYNYVDGKKVAKVIVVHSPPQERNCPASCTNGICNEHGSCTCWNGYVSTHPLNQICKPSCPKGCINSECTSPNTCSCNAGYIRDISDSTVCNPICFLHCLNGRCVSPNTCVCNLGYTKDPTDDSVCNPVCSPPCVNGNCVSPDTCMCNPGYTKDPINTSVCNLNIFSYECKTGYIKHNSLCIPYCPKGCTNGICTAPDTCKCKEGFEEDNENVCIFKNRSYSSTVADGASDHQLHPAADTHIPLWVLLVCTAAISVLVIGTAIYLRYYRRERRPPPYSECNHGAGIWITSK